MTGQKVEFINSLSPKALKLLARLPVENPNPVLIIGLDGVLHYANDAFFSVSIFSQYKIGEPVEGTFRKAVDESALSGRTVEIEVEMDGTFFLFTVTPVFDANCTFLFGREITQRKKQEISLRQMALIAKETDNSTVITDPAGKITWVNKSFTKLTGYSAEEVMGRMPGDFLQGPGTDPVVVEKLAKALKNRESIEAEIINYSKQGVSYLVNLQIQPVFNEQGILENFISIQRNVTEEKYLQNKIIDSEHKLSLMIESALDAIVILDEQGQIQTWNPQSEVIFGYPKDEILGKPLEMLLFNDQAATSAFHQFDNILTFKSGKVEKPRIEIYGKRKDGEVFPVEMTVMPLKDRDNNLVSVFLRDISLQKRIQVRYESTNSRLTALIRNLKSGILVEDENRLIALINQEFCSLFAIPAPPDQLIGLDCTLSAQQSKSLFRDPEGFVSGINQILEKQELVLNEELELADGRTYERDYIPIFFEGTFLGNLWQYRDITSRKQSQVQLEQAMLAAEKANKAKSNFLANMSHEIRTPLNAVYGIIRLLSEAPHLPEQEDLHNRLLTSSENLLTIINEILDFSKIEAGLLTLEQTPFKLRELVERIAVSYDLKASQRSLELRHHIDSSISNFLVGDQVRIGQVITNLVSNAIKFTDKGFVEINCKLLSADSGNNRIYFSIRDTGVGIDDTRLDKIFESYEQEEISTTRQYGGTGLGLSISRQLVEMMGGKLQVISVKGQGSTFYFTLELPVGAQQIEEEKTRLTQIDKEKLRDVRVLVVEDNDMNQFVAKSILEKWNLKVFLVKNGQKAVEFLSLQSVDIILMDKQMPVMDGVEATKIIRNELGLTLPIIALTADAVIEMVEECLEAGMNDYVTKPFDPAILFHKISKALGK
jgi:PAS domain S-box-containing protein